MWPSRPNRDVLKMRLANMCTQLVHSELFTYIAHHHTNMYIGWIVIAHKPRILCPSWL